MKYTFCINLIMRILTATNMSSSFKTIIILYTLPVIFLSASCNNGDKRSSENTGVQKESQPDNVTEQKAPVSSTGFDINSIPVSDHDLGEFPFFGLPEGLAEQNKPIQRKFDRLFFPIDGIMTPIEGKVWKSFIEMEAGNTDEWSLPYFEKSYDEAIKAVGGVKIFDGEISKEEYDRYNSQASYLGEDGSIGYTGENTKVYIIRRADNSDVYIQLAGNTASGKINILQKEPFKQTITMLKSDQIQKELTDKGKAILYINFDLDKATLKSDGKEAVIEIAKVLNNDQKLKLSIEGHTDNTGNSEHNKKLSEDRASTVLNELSASGIDKSRLEAVGYGAERPLVANNLESGKAKNRRVELVKINQ